MRGVCYFVWGDSCNEALERSIASVRKFHPDLPVHVERGAPANPDEGLLLKARMFEFSPFSTTLFLDADTVVLDNLDYAFAKAERHGLACCISEAAWARRHVGLAGAGDLIEYNTGVLFFSAGAKAVFDAWAKLAAALDSSIMFADKQGNFARMACDDQAGFALALHQLEFVPFVLPLNWNFRPKFQQTYFGPLKIWHAYEPVPSAIDEYNNYYRRPNAILHFHELK